jgi:hypothetical protein
MKKRVVILLSVVVGFFGAILAIPDAPTMKPSRLAKKLPESFSHWLGKPEEPGAEEKKILARDTEFERVRYVDRDGLMPSVQASIVFSGKNLSQSIHRPEVCLRAQGWQFVSEKYLGWEGVLPDGEILPVKELVCRRVFQVTNEEGDPEPVLTPEGEQAYLWRTFYYTFVGHEKILAGHYQRTGEDIKDRLFKGYDQRWAYATFSSYITLKHAEQGIRVDQGTALNEEETSAHIRSFLKDLLPAVISAPGKGYDESLESGKDLGS